MIRLAHPRITHIFEFTENKVCGLIIENADFFRETVNDIYKQTQGLEGRYVLSKDYSPIEFSKHSDVLTEFAPFDINRRMLTTKIAAAIEAIAVDEGHYCATNELVARIEDYYADIALDFPCEILFTKLTPQNVVKALGIKIAEDYDSLAEQLITYMELVREFDRDRVFVFVNLRSYMNDEMAERFIHDALVRKLKMLFIDNSERQRIATMDRVIIDADLCEI